MVEFLIGLTKNETLDGFNKDWFGFLIHTSTIVNPIAYFQGFLFFENTVPPQFKSVSFVLKIISKPFLFCFVIRTSFWYWTSSFLPITPQQV